MAISDRMKALLGEAKTGVQSLAAHYEGVVTDLKSDVASLEGEVESLVAMIKGIKPAASFTLTVTAEASSGSTVVMVKGDGVPAKGAAVSGPSIADGTTVLDIDADSGKLILSKPITADLAVDAVLTVALAA